MALRDDLLTIVPERLHKTRHRRYLSCANEYLSFPLRLLGSVVGRPPIGASARDVVAACRLTKSEKALISARYGTPAIFFRLMIDREMAKGVEGPQEGEE